MSSEAEVDPVALLKEITQIAMDRMNYGVDVGSWEAMTLGKITGVAVRYPGLLEGLRDVSPGAGIISGLREGLRDVSPGTGIIFDHAFVGADLRRCGSPGCGRPAGDHQDSVSGMSYGADDTMRVPPSVTD